MGRGASTHVLAMHATCLLQNTLRLQRCKLNPSTMNAGLLLVCHINW